MIYIDHLRLNIQLSKVSIIAKSMNTIRILLARIFVMARILPATARVASMRMICSLGVFTLCMILRPHISGHTFWFDAVCYTCLIVQFGLQNFFANVDYFAITFTESQEQFYFAIFQFDIQVFSCSRV